MHCSDIRHIAICSIVQPPSILGCFFFPSVETKLCISFSSVRWRVRYFQAYLKALLCQIFFFRQPETCGPDDTGIVGLQARRKTIIFVFA